MGFFDLIEQDDRVRFSPHGLRQLSAFIVAHISRRRSDQTGHGIFLHIFTHVDPDHVVLIVKQALGKSLGKLCLADAGRSKEQERSNRFGRILDAGFGPDNRLCYLRNAFILTNNPFVEFIRQMQGLASLAFIQLGNRDPRPPGDDLGNLILCHTLVYQRQILIFDLFFLFFQLFLQLRQSAVLKLCRFIQVIALLCAFDLTIQLFNLLTELLDMLYGSLFIIPLCLLFCKCFSLLCQLLLQFCQTFLAQPVVFLLQGSLFDLQLHDLTVQCIQL